MGYLVLLDTLITIHQEVIGYLVLLDTLITVHRKVSINSRSPIASFLCKALVTCTFQNSGHNRERDDVLFITGTSSVVWCSIPCQSHGG
jgi:hypothetical protein